MEYFESLNKIIKNDTILEMEDFAKENHVPIIKEDSLYVICALIKILNAKKVLEIGSAIGYSAILMATQKDDLHVSTIERVKEMYDKACANISKASLDDRINIIYGDALDVDLDLLDNDYDLFFIDAAKAQYKRFIERYEKKLKPGGVIICDNLLFHGLVEHEEKEEVSRDIKQLLRKIRVINEWLSNNPNYDTYFLRIGDGLSISIKK